MSTIKWNEAAYEMLQEWLSLYNEKEPLRSRHLHNVKDKLHQLTEQEFMMEVSKELHEVYKVVKTERKQYDMTNGEFLVTTLLSTDYPAFLEARSQNLRRVEKLKQLHTDILSLFETKINTSSEMTSLLNRFFDAISAYGQTKKLANLEAKCAEYLPTFMDVDQKREGLKEDALTAQKQESELLEEWNQLRKKRYITKQTATAFRTKQHEYNESIRRLTVANKQLEEIDLPGLKNSFANLEADMKAYAIEALRAIEKEINEMINDSERAQQQLQKQIEKVSYVEEMDAHYKWLSSFMNASRTFFQGKEIEAFDQVADLYRSSAIAEFIEVAEEVQMLTVTERMSPVSLPSYFASLQVKEKKLSVPVTADYPVLEKQQKTKRTFPFFVGAVLAIVLIFVVYMNFGRGVTDDNTAPAMTEKAEAKDKQSAENESKPVKDVSETEIHNFVGSYKAAYFSSLNSGDFSGMAPYIDEDAQVYSDLEAYITSLAGKNVSFANDQLLVSKVEKTGEGKYSVYATEEYTFTDSYDASTKFVKNRIYRVELKGEDKLKIKSIETTKDVQTPVK
ncbi:hypothetical protein LZP85_09620 [Priestia flexa]|uniref:TcaA protein NTF2-like domain-containing protein n=1 Tax=Priestia flexa TaxID=86664 RepID=A0A8I1MGE5_9BACI|nr:hypothetical protein [Priestia flexa]MBN8252148.1 hypothetical protein [Priestia flexa]UIR31996.1 hypothetical protein LZP85_09620 [Priestia flexa]